MNKRYMDFVPVSVTHKIVRDDVDEVKKSESSKETAVSEKKQSLKNEPKFGVIEDLQPRFVKTEVEKRPLSRPTPKVSPEVKVAKQAAEEKVLQNAVKQANKLVENDAPSRKNEEPRKRTELKTPFVNTEKVAKRPLSKNVYQKKVVVPKEEPEKSITIITSEKKDSKIGVVVAVIITIILGATAGTVAFLLLPK